MRGLVDRSRIGPPRSPAHTQIPRRLLALSALALIVGGCGTAGVSGTATGLLKGGEVPLTVVAHGYAVAVYAPVTIHERTYFFRVDTGAAHTVVTKRVASALGLQKHGLRYRMQAVGCAASVQPVRVAEWRLGRIKLPTTVIDEAHIDLGPEKMDGRPVVGLLGSDVLRRFGRATFEFWRQRLILGSKAPADGQSANFTQLHTHTGGYAELVGAKINGRSVRLAVDTGASLTGIDGATARLLRLKRFGQSGPISGATGCSVVVHSVSITHWTVGAVTLPSTYALAGPVSLKYRGFLIQGLLGADVLSSYRQVTFDFTIRRLVILGRPRPRFRTKPAHR
jgi:predicted aspartyl protease